MKDETRKPLHPGRAILLLGPTGSGKTPLGHRLAEKGLRKARCVHFDFGANLRSIVDGDRPVAPFQQAEIAFLREVLNGGTLLEDEHFPIAQRILQWFWAQQNADAETLMVLNGIPRHVGQAEALDAVLHVEMVIALTCEAQTVLRRIENNAGGDRCSRRDDDQPSVLRKLELFHTRTQPLLAYYRQRGARIVHLDITATTTPDQAWQALQTALDRQPDVADAGNG